MAYAAALSKTKILAFSQCPRRLWLEQYNPELEEFADDTDSLIAIGREVGEAARQVYGRDGGERITFEAGQRAAVNATQALLDAGGTTPIFEATFDHDGLIVQVDIFDRSGGQTRLVEVKASTSVKDHHVLDCAIQTWAVEQLGRPLDEIALAHIDADFVYSGDGDYGGLFAEQDISEAVRALIPSLPEQVAGARETLGSLDEPDVAVGPQCFSPHPCPFYAHCEPPQGRYPVTGLGGSKKRLFDLMKRGYTDLRDVPEEDLANESQERIWRQTKSGQPYVGAGMKQFIARLGHPRYYLDFETIAFAVPRWAGTRPYEALPFQWSCHIDDGRDPLVHRSFLDLTGQPPMRHAAEQLIAALGDEGPIIVYTSYEKRVIHEFATLYPDLETALNAIRDRLVDLHPAVREDYYHPDMLGSWSIKAVLPTVAPELDYSRLGAVQDGPSAQQAYLEAIDPGTGDERRDQLRQALLDYCGYDTLALVKLVEYFSPSA
jgi:hypothetical protein